MKSVLKLIIFILISINCFANEGETEITTEDGIEVFQDEKFYLLKKNVIIKSENFTLNADNVRINFDKSLYDITMLNAKGDVRFNSIQYKTNGSGENLIFEVPIEKLKVVGKNSKLFTENIKMTSDGLVEINNQNGNFLLRGSNSKLASENIIIVAESIIGKFTNKKGENEITFLDIFDEKISYIKNNNTEMYAKKINYDYDTSIIELIDDVTIIRNEEKIIGDYGTLDTKNNSYKIKSKKESKVKIIIQDYE